MDIKKVINDVSKNIEETVNKSSTDISKGAKTLKSQLELERKKMDLRSQIGKHQRTVQKAYTRLGELYYRHETEGLSLDGMNDILDILKSNNKIIELLQENLKQLESE